MKLLVFLFLASVPTALGEYYRCKSNTHKGFNDTTAIEYDQTYDATTGTRTYEVKTDETSISGTCRGNVEGTTLPADTMPVEGLTLNMLQESGDGDKTITNLSLTWGTVNFDSFLVRHECNQQPYMRVTTTGSATGCHVVGLADSGSLNCHESGLPANGNYFKHDDADCTSLDVSVIIGGLKDCGSDLSTADSDRKRTLTFTAENWCGDEFTNVTVDADNDTIVVSFGGVAATQDLGSNTSTDGWTSTSNDLTTQYDISVADVSFNLYDGGTTDAATDLVNGSSYDLTYVYTSSHTPDAQFTKTVLKLLNCIVGTHKSQNHGCEVTSDPWGSTKDTATENTNAAAKTKQWKYSKEMDCDDLNEAVSPKDCCFSAQFVLSTKIDDDTCTGTAANRRALSSPQVSGRWLQLSDNAFTETSRAFTMRVLRQSEVDNAGVDVTVAVEDEDSGVAGWVPPVAVAALLICAALVYTLTRSPKMLQRALGPATKVLPTE
jgi:hypothetical protein